MSFSHDGDYINVFVRQPLTFSKLREKYTKFSTAVTANPIPKPNIDLSSTKTSIEIELSYVPVTQYILQRYKVNVFEVTAVTGAATGATGTTTPPATAATAATTGTTGTGTNITTSTGTLVRTPPAPQNIETLVATENIVVTQSSLSYRKTINNLKTGQDYKVKAVAVTNGGESDQAENSITTKSNSVPKIVKDVGVSIEFVDNKPSAKVSFTPLSKPEDIGFLPITKYTAYAKSNAGDEFSADATTVTNPSPIVIPNLKANKSAVYSFTVVASNSLGAGLKNPDPATFKFSTLVPQSPIITDVTKGDGKVTLEFTVPESKRPITGYVIKAFNGDDSSPVCVTRKVFTDAELLNLQTDEIGKITLDGLENDVYSNFSPSKDLSTFMCSGEPYTYINLRHNNFKVCFNWFIIFLILLCIVLMFLTKKTLC